MELTRSMSRNEAARLLGRPSSWFSQNLARYQSVGVAGLLPKRRQAGAKPEYEPAPEIMDALRSLNLKTNRTRESGSVPEAVRQFVFMPEPDRKRHGIPACPEDFREYVIGRLNDRKPIVPVRLQKQIKVPASVVRQYRNPTDANLDFIAAPGSTMWIEHPETRQRTFIRSGDVVEADDATINFPVVIPWTIGGCPCSDRYGVKVGRFQWLLARDVGSRMYLGFTYVMRPRASYRAEDVLSLMRVVTKNHGVPRHWRFEKGVWRSNVVRDAIKRMGSKRWEVYSPHAKPFIEGGFNTLWTKLSLVNGQVGRFRAEMEKENDILMACQQGRRDPRQTFPMLADALEALHRAIAELNSQRINSPNYGSWIPEERWEAQLADRPLAPLDSESEWLFAPMVREWTVRGALVGGRVPLFEGLSVPFDFSADWLPKFSGAKVRCYFDPTEAQCSATLVLVQNWGDHKAGDVVGTAEQINEVAGYARLVMGWGRDDASLGRKVRQQNAAAMRREVRAILPRGKRGASSSEVRDGLGNKAAIENTKTAKPRSSTRPRVNRAPDLSEERRQRAEQFERDNALDFV